MQENKTFLDLAICVTGKPELEIAKKPQQMISRFEKLQGH